MYYLGSVSVPGAKLLKSLEFPSWGVSNGGLLLGLQREHGPADEPTKAVLVPACVSLGPFSGESSVRVGDTG